MLRRLRIDVPTLLSVLYAPLQPLVKRLHLVRRGSRRFEPADINLPDGYAAEVVARGLTAPVHVCFDPDGVAYVTESGHKSDSPPRVVRVDLATGALSTAVDLADRWTKTGAATGAAWHEGGLIIANTDALLRADLESGDITELVGGLPGLGDHQTNHPLIGPDGRVYWGQGSATNMGVVGADNFGYEWLSAHPQVCDVPAEDIELVGRNFLIPNVLGNPVRELAPLP